MADSFELALDRRQWSAADLTMPVFVVRSGRDFWSRPEDAQTLVADAPKAELIGEPADRLRDELRELGWEVRDGPQGPELVPAA